MSDYDIFNFIWDVTVTCGYSLLLMVMLYVTFRIIVYFITSMYITTCRSKEVKSITIPFKGHNSFESASDNIEALTKRLNLMKDGSHILVKDIMHITTTPSDNGINCTVWYSVRKKKKIKVSGNLYDNFSPYNNLRIFGEDRNAQRK